MKLILGKFAPAKALRLGYATALVGLSFLSGTKPVAAQDFPVDLAMKFCASKQEDNTAMAINDFGTGICAWGYSTIGEAKQGALSKCTGYVPKSMRQKVKCHVVWENGEITDAKLVEIMRKPYRMPVMIEIDDGADKSRQGMPGYMDFGPAPDKLSRTTTIYSADGQKICSGIARMRQLKLEFDFTAKCFGSRSLKGSAKVIGLREIGGLHRLALDLMIHKNPGYIHIVAD
jgi:hypothetical protein